MSWKSPGFHWNPLKDLKRFSLHISRFLFTPSLLFTYILCTMQHMLGPIMTMRIILSHVKTRGMAGGRSVGVAFFQPPSNIIQTHSNVIQNLKPQKISVKKVCLLFPTEILLNALAQNWHRCGFPCGIGFLCGRSWVWEPTAPFCIRRSSKDGLVMNMNIIEYPSRESHPPKQWICLKCRKASGPDFWSFCSELWSTSVTRLYLRFTPFCIYGNNSTLLGNNSRRCVNQVFCPQAILDAGQEALGWVIAAAATSGQESAAGD